MQKGLPALFPESQTIRCKTAKMPEITEARRAPQSEWSDTQISNIDEPKPPIRCLQNVSEMQRTEQHAALVQKRDEYRHTLQQGLIQRACQCKLA